MTEHCLQLFRYTARHLTPEDVTAFAPADPGYRHYVSKFTAILETQAVPKTADFEITETIALTRWTEASQTASPNRFRRFRTFVNAVGMAIRATGHDTGDSMPENYFAISLLDDAKALNDPDLSSRLSPAFAELHAVLTAADAPVSGEAPFLLLAQILLGYMGFHGAEELPRLARQLIDEESACSGRSSADFLWGCTGFNQLHHHWKRFVKDWLPDNPADRDIALLRAALLPS